MRVYIDISEFMKIDAITGIQRVMREILVRFIMDKRLEIILLDYSDKRNYFRVIDNQRFLEYFKNRKGEKGVIYSNLYLNIKDMKEGEIFFDLDVAWTATLKRSYLLPLLKQQGVKIVAQIYDIMAITHFQYFTEHFTYTFMEYIGAHIQYADTIIVSTKASLDVLEEFAHQAGVKSINGKVAYLGADFQKSISDMMRVKEEIREVAQRQKYILMVGTIEPRKNHQLVLEAFDKGIGKLGYNLIFAGRLGWKNEDFLKKLKSHKMYEKNIFHIDNASNADIDYLYNNAFLVAFPTHMEGFGLPLVEALEHGVPVIASDIEVLREIGEDYCYYFRENDVDDFVKIVSRIEKQKEMYQHKREKLKSYKPITWEQSAEMMFNAIIE